MELRLTPLEARVVGCLLEKEIATPEQYPLSLNALVNACNQKSNRDPVLDLKESEVLAVVEALEKRYLVTSQTGFGSRVAKYAQRLCNTEFGSLRFSPQEVAVLTELLLRGAQMPGELRSRATRLAPFDDVAAMERTLEALAAREDGPFVVRLAREPGRRESRYMHCFGGEVPGAEIPSAETSRASAVEAPRAAATADPSRPSDRVAALEEEVADLKARVARLEAALASTGSLSREPE